MTTICLKLAEQILPIVCDASPEGYLPDNDESIPQTAESAKAQMIVVNAWRSIKETGYLFAEMVKQSLKLEKNLEMLSENLMLKIGYFFITIFIESKHKGVFEQAHTSFSLICEHFWA